MNKSTRRQVSGIALLVGAVLFGLIALQRIPPREDLVSVAGRLVSLTPAQPGRVIVPVRFQIGSNGVTYQYITTGGEMQSVEDALREAGSSEIRILIDREDDFVYPNAFEVIVGERVIRSLDQVLAKFEENRRMSLWFAGALAVAGLLFLAAARRSRW